MSLKAWLQRGSLFWVVVFWLCPAWAQQPGYPTQPYGPMTQRQRPQANPRPRPTPPPYQRLAERTTPVPNPARVSLDPRPGEHPLMPVLRWAAQGLKQMEGSVRDYSCVVFKKERQEDGKLGAQEKMFVKIRHKPFSVYMRFLEPDKLDGQEVIYVEGANDGKMLAHGAGALSFFGTWPLEPRSERAMKGQHYPITDMGIQNLVKRLLEVGQHDARFGECQVKYRHEAKINNRVCTFIEVIHPVPRRDFRFHIAHIFVDNQLNFPTRYASYTWPKKKGDKPELIEEYTYVDIKLNRGFTDADFDIRNPNYGFKEGKKK